MNKKALTLSIMIGWDFSLHLVEKLDLIKYHFLYPRFPLFGQITYDSFWTVFWFIGFLLALNLIKEKK